MTAAASANVKRGFQFLKARTDERAAHGEEVRDALLTAVDELISKARVIDPTAASEFEQQAKRLRLHNNAEYWCSRRHLSAIALLRGA